MELNREELIRVTKSLIKISQGIEANPSPEKSGGILTLTFKGFFNGYPIIPFPSGYSEEKLEKYWKFSKEKAHRVFAHWLRKSEEVVSSYQTRNPEEDMWGGAVLFPPHVNERGIESNGIEGIVSFSGLSELSDEALSLTLGIDYFKFPGANEDFARRVVEVSGNKIYHEMSQRFKQ